MSRVAQDLFLSRMYDKQAGFLGAGVKLVAKGASKIFKPIANGIKNWANKGIAKEGEAWVKNQKSQIVKNLTPMQQGGKSVNIMSPAFKGSSPATQSVFKNVPNFSDPNVVRRHGMMNWAGKTVVKGGTVAAGTAMIGKGLFGDNGQNNGIYKSNWQGRGNRQGPALNNNPWGAKPSTFSTTQNQG